jgi:hypothetical protein
MTLDIPFPTLNINSFNVGAPDPDSTRHLVSGSLAYNRLLGIEDCGLALDFGTITLTVDDIEAVSNVIAVNYAFPDFGTLIAQSGEPTQINNFKLWLPEESGTVLVPPGISLQVVTSGDWVLNFAFPSGGGEELSSTLPLFQNLFRLDGHSTLSGYAATEVTQYVYFRLFLDVDFPIGSFGLGCGGSGILRPRLTYDFY